MYCFNHRHHRLDHSVVAVMILWNLGYTIIIWNLAAFVFKSYGPNGEAWRLTFGLHKEETPSLTNKTFPEMSYEINEQTLVKEYNYTYVRISVISITLRNNYTYDGNSSLITRAHASNKAGPKMPPLRLRKKLPQNLQIIVKVKQV